MRQNHPTVRELESFLTGGPRRTSIEGNSLIIRHLLAECATCREHLNAMGWDSERLERLVHLAAHDSLSPRDGYNYDRAFQKAQAALDAFLANVPSGQEDIEPLLRELEALPLDLQCQQATAEGRFANPALVKHLVQRSHEIRYKDPESMLHLAHLAQLISEACSVEAVGAAQRLADLRAQGWRQFGNSLRVSGRMREAEEAFMTAQSYCQQGTGDPKLRAGLLEQMASLRIFQRNFASAVELAEDAGEIYRRLGEMNSLASAIVQKAIACLYAGDPESAVEALNRAIPLMDQERDPYLLLAACHNLILSYIDLDQPEQALSLYSEARALYQEFGDALLLLRNAWQEGRLLRDLGHLEGAEASLVQAREGFVHRSLAYEVAVISLDLASVYVKIGKSDKVYQMVAETVPLFRALQVGREMIASLLQIRRLSDQQEALDKIRHLTTRLERLSKKAS